MRPAWLRCDGEGVPLWESTRLRIALTGAQVPILYPRTLSGASDSRLVVPLKVAHTSVFFATFSLSQTLINDW